VEGPKLSTSYETCLAVEPVEVCIKCGLKTYMTNKLEARNGESHLMIEKHAGGTRLPYVEF